jgi:hypothetical protein
MLMECGFAINASRSHAPLYRPSSALISARRLIAFGLQRRAPRYIGNTMTKLRVIEAGAINPLEMALARWTRIAGCCGPAPDVPPICQRFVDDPKG